MKLKHNKRRNTAFIYEALVKELTKVSISEQNKDKKIIAKTLHEFFNKKSDLGKELELYKSIYETRGISEKDAEKILNEVKRVYSGLNQDNIFNIQNKLISAVNKSVSPKVFQNFVPNYKTLASISQIFAKNISVKNKIMLERQLIKHMTSTRKEQKKNEPVVSHSVIRVFAKKFNSTYENLYEEQKQLLSKYVSSFQDNGLDLKIFLNEEIGRLKEKLFFLSEEKGIKEDTDLNLKVTKVSDILNDMSGQLITEEVLTSLLKVQALVRESQK
tara:strand:+ start:227 stop:1045 length:819 start_codon:yes stop_codon:yes gene_type:complete